MSQWAIYNPGGRIDRVYSGPENEALLQPEGDEQVVALPDGWADDTAYISSGQAVAKQPFNFAINKTQIVANGIDTAIISNVPNGTKATWWDGEQAVITDGVVEFDTDLPGTYKVTFSAIPYLDQEVTIEAVSAT